MSCFSVKQISGCFVAYSAYVDNIEQVDEFQGRVIDYLAIWKDIRYSVLEAQIIPHAHDRGQSQETRRDIKNRIDAQYLE